MGQKFYSIRKGKKPGIYLTWAEAQKQIHGFSGAEYKSFTTRQEAEDFFKGDARSLTSIENSTGKLIAYVDGSFDKVNGRYSSGVVLLIDDTIQNEFYLVGNKKNYVESYQIAGEVQAALEAIRWAKKEGYKSIIICYDYEGIEKWATGQWQAKKSVSQDYVVEFNALSKDVDVSFHKVKAHIGITYNERADELANIGLREARK